MEIRLSLHWILDLLGAEASCRGVYDRDVTGIAGLGEAVPGDLSFLSNARYRKQLTETRASVVLVPAQIESEPREDQAFILTAAPSLALARICGRIEAQLWPKVPPGVHPSAVVDPSARIAPTATIGPLCVIGEGAEVGEGAYLVSHVAVGRYAGIGRDCRMEAHVAIGDYCRVGNGCRFHAGVVIGSDGFGYAPSGDRLMKLPQIGVVVVEDEVEIGANTTIDRARFAETRIGRGTKIDNLVHIGHNCRIGRCSALAAQVGVSGSTEIGSGVLILGQAGLAGHIKVGDGAEIAGQAGVNRDVPPGMKVRGSPHTSQMEFARMKVLQRRLPEFLKRIEKLEEIVETSR